MGKFGVIQGNYRAQNHQAGVTTVSTNGSGNGSSTISFRQTMKKSSYGVQLTPLQSGSEVWTTGVLMAGSRTNSGFKIYVRGANTTSSVVKISYDAFDDSYR